MYPFANALRYSPLLGDFYRISERDMYLTPLELRLMTNEELVGLVQDAIVIYEQQRAKQAAKLKRRFQLYMAVVTIAVGGAAMAGSGSATAAGPATQSATASLNAAGTAATTSSTLSQVQTVAKYISGASSIYSQATGNEPSRLAQAADLLSSPSWQDAATKGAKFALNEQGERLAEDDKAGQQALQELIRRESETYAGKLRQLAEQEARAKQLPVTTVQDRRESTLQVASLAIPVILFALSQLS